MGSHRKKKPRYRWRAFTHWLNLVLLGAGSAAAVFYDPSVWFVLAPLEAGLMWLVPDLPPFRAKVDQEVAREDLLRERAYYMEQLWGLIPAPRKGLGAKIASWFTEAAPDLAPEDRVINREAPSFRKYLEMKQIITKLQELEEVRGGVSIPEKDLRRFEQVLNGYLRFVIAARSIEQALEGMNEQQLRRELAEIEANMQQAHPELRHVLLERKRLKQAGLERMPKLRAMRELFRTRADAIVQQMRNVQGQSLADPGTNVNAFLDDLVERQEIMADPLGALEADHLIDDLLSKPSVSAANQQQRAAAARQPQQRGR